jgi:RHS repeat-associated protein
LSAQKYSYDGASRLTSTADSSGATGCAVRNYAFDADTNRTSLNTRSPNADGSCAASGGSTTTATFDGADRAINTGYAYDDHRNTISTPAADTPTNTTLTATYYTNDRTRTLTAGGDTRTFELDPSARLRSWTDSGDGITRTLHYTGDTDSLAWTTTNSSGTAWSRQAQLFGGVAAVVDHSSGGSATISLQLVDMHGSVVATAATGSTTYTGGLETDEYGRPRSGTPAALAYLGGKSRQTDTLTGLSLFGLRDYNSTTGRFLAGDNGQDAHSNAYGYVGADPVNHADLSGTCTDSKAWQGHAFAGTHYTQYGSGIGEDSTTTHVYAKGTFLYSYDTFLHIPVIATDYCIAWRIHYGFTVRSGAALFSNDILIIFERGGAHCGSYRGSVLTKHSRDFYVNPCGNLFSDHYDVTFLLYGHGFKVVLDTWVRMKDDWYIR